MRFCVKRAKNRQTMKYPQKLPLDKIYDIVPPSVRENKKVVAYRGGIGVVVGITGAFFRHLGQSGTPYLLEDYRMGLVKRGALHGYINLREYVIPAGTIVFVTPGTIVEPIGTSDDFLLEGMGVPAEQFLMAHGGKLPDLFSGRMGDGRMALPEESAVILDRMLRLLHSLILCEDTSKNVINNVIAAISNYFDQLFLHCDSAPVASHSVELFNHFLQLVNQHGRREHRLSFYASELCISSRYLCTLVQSVSGVGAKEWIDRAIIAAAKVQLRHTDKQITQIADELNFPNPSFFCKYFKRLTGMTPLRYRSKK